MKGRVILLLGSLAIFSCIDRINIEMPDSYSSHLVVDGSITDEQGPYTVTLTKATRLEKFLQFHREFVTGALVSISDNAGNSELLTEKEPGIYQTKAGGIQGVIGRSYSIRVETKESNVYESLPDIMSPVGQLDSLYYELETIQPIDKPTQYGFRIFVDAQGAPDKDNLLRWRFTGVFEINTHPELYGKVISFVEPPQCQRGPLPCTFDGPGGICSCCKCWVSHYETKPHLNDNQFVLNGKFKKVEVGYVPLEYFPFQHRYRFEVNQMSLSPAAFEYWKIVKSQKEGVGSLFQPPTGKSRTNIFRKNGDGDVQGIFYASAIKTKYLYLNNSDVISKWRGLIVPRWDCEIGKIAEDCRVAFRFSTTTKPADWK